MSNMSKVYADDASGCHPTAAAYLSSCHNIAGSGQAVQFQNTVRRQSSQMMAGDIGPCRDLKSFGHTLSANANKLTVDDDDCRLGYSRQVQG